LVSEENPKKTRKKNCILGGDFNFAFLTGAKRREWTGCWGLLGVAGMIITSDDWDHFRKFPA